MFKLVISDDEGKTTVVPLLRDEVTIGREDGNTIRLTERNVSRKHARLARANGTLTVEDLSSYNGVKVNGEKIGDARVLSAGDQVSIGDYLLALQVDQADAASTVPTAKVAAPKKGHDPATAMIRTPEARPPARLVMLSEPAPGAEFAVNRDVLRVGRAEDLDAWVNHRSISREHAELVRAGDGYQIQDLGSANGIRINGKEVDQSDVANGDVIELGQVVFRFVAAGDPYYFDPSHTVTIEGPEGGAPLPRFALVLGIGMIALACGVAVYFALAPPTGHRGAGTTPENGPSSDTPSAIELSAALDACDVNLASGKFQEAVSAAERALSLSNSLSAERCLAAARVGVEDQQIFDRGCNELAAGQVDDALRTFSSLSVNSFFAERTEIEDAKMAWGQQRLDMAHEKSRDDPPTARRLAEEVLSSTISSDSQQEEAQNLLKLLSESAGSVPPGASPSHQRPGMVEAPPRREVPTETQAPTAETDPASRCREVHGLGPGYNPCLIQNVPENSRADITTLVSAHRALGNTAAACRLMRNFVNRYPTARVSSQYNQLLNLQCD